MGVAQFQRLFKNRFLGLLLTLEVKVLRDAFMENQTVVNYEEVCASKVSSTMNLDALSRDLCPSLQWFVCFSSVSCGRGNAGQTNYGYANSVMESICEQRTRENLPGLAIQWGPIGDVGILQDTVGSDVVINGTISQSIRSCLSVLDKFLQQKHPVVLSCIPYLPAEYMCCCSFRDADFWAVEFQRRPGCIAPLRHEVTLNSRKSSR
ncbi:fatty acid synthase [Trichonephila clavipes]|nr:fatty acid synthase [Trichonephila clavipes]